MSFRAEVREFIAEQKMDKQVIAILLSELDALRKVNKDLMDRLMAKNFEELKIYQANETEVNHRIEKPYEVESDEGNAGEIV